MVVAHLPAYLVDAFVTPRGFSGNPAAVVLTASAGLLDDAQRLTIAAEFNLSETAFVAPLPSSAVEAGHAAFRCDAAFSLRWFTPTNEVDLCGHATLAAAHVLFEACGNAGAALTFETRSGPLRVARRRDGGGVLLGMRFPMNAPRSLPLPSAPSHGAAPWPAPLHAIAAAVLSTTDPLPLLVGAAHDATTRKLVLRLRDGEVERLRALPQPSPQALLAVDQVSLPSSLAVRGVSVTVRLLPGKFGGNDDGGGATADFASRCEWLARSRACGYASMRFFLTRGYSDADGTLLFVLLWTVSTYLPEARACVDLAYVRAVSSVSTVPSFPLPVPFLSLSQTSRPGTASPRTPSTALPTQCWRRCGRTRWRLRGTTGLGGRWRRLPLHSALRIASRATRAPAPTTTLRCRGRRCTMRQ
jgi:predicted PhzF superfamily epimerase YddE/YHI9